MTVEGKQAGALAPSTALHSGVGLSYNDPLDGKAFLSTSKICCSVNMLGVTTFLVCA